MFIVIYSDSWISVAIYIYVLFWLGDIILSFSFVNVIFILLILSSFYLSFYLSFSYLSIYIYIYLYLFIYLFL